MDQVEELEKIIATKEHDISLLKAALGVMLFRDYPDMETKVSMGDITVMINENYFFNAKNDPEDPNNFLIVRLVKKDLVPDECKTPELEEPKKSKPKSKKKKKDDTE